MLATIGLLYAGPAVWLGLGGQERGVVMGALRTLLAGKGRETA